MYTKGIGRLILLINPQQKLNQHLCWHLVDMSINASVMIWILISTRYHDITIMILWFFVKQKNKHSELSFFWLPTLVQALSELFIKQREKNSGKGKQVLYVLRYVSCHEKLYRCSPDRCSFDNRRTLDWHLIDPRFGIMITGDPWFIRWWIRFWSWCSGNLRQQQWCNKKSFTQ